MQPEANLYQQKYKELNLLGKGNYGKAYKVKGLFDGRFYVAKRVYLEGLSEAQIQAAWGEIEILKKFNDLSIPFIVEYKECFQFENELVIIMEYCESGDLSTFIKNCKQKKQIINERVIAHWLIQLLWGLQALHSKNVLHRDLKAANVFITSNFTLKIGDFGISKILQSTSAKTCIGTPLYLSPQVCNALPYSFSSDLWALGCIMYELCCLKYPFEASNMIVLAKKIVCDEVKPIPDYYSRQLNEIVLKLLTKDSKKRVTTPEILKFPYVKASLATFIQEQGRIKEIVTPLELVSSSQEANFADNQPKGAQSSLLEKSMEQDTMKTINSVMEQSSGVSNTSLAYSSTLTAGEKLKLKKQEQSQKRFDEMKEAARGKQQTTNFAKQTKLWSLGHTTGVDLKSQTKKMEQEIQRENKAKSEIKYRAKEMERKQGIDINLITNTIKNLKIHDRPEQFQDLPLPSNSSFVPINTLHKSGFAEENIEEELDEYEDEEFDEYVEENPLEKTAVKKNEMESVRAFYENEMGETMSPARKERVIKVFHPEQIRNVSNKEKLESKRQLARDQVGSAKFQDLYTKVKNNKIDYSNLKVNFNESEQLAIRFIEELIYLQSQ